VCMFTLNVVRLIAFCKHESGPYPACTASAAHMSWPTRTPSLANLEATHLQRLGHNVTLTSPTLSFPHVLQPRRLQQIRNSPRQSPSINRQLHQTPKRLQHCCLRPPRRPPRPPTNFQRCCVTSAIVQRQPGWQWSIQAAVAAAAAPASTAGTAAAVCAPDPEPCLAKESVFAVWR
jgi:hypothetical protein